MSISTLITPDHEIKCVILPTRRTLITGGSEVLAYAQHSLVKGFTLDDSYVSLLETIVNWCIIPELDEMLYEIQSIKTE